MRSRASILVGLVLLTGACGGSSASNCTEYAAEVRERIETTDSAADLMEWVEDTSEHAGKLIQNDRDNAAACASALLDALFTAGVMEFETMLDSAFDQ